MTSLQRVGSIILFAVGGLLALLGGSALILPAPADVPENIHRTVTQIFVVAGVAGIGLIALGAFVRSPRVSGRLVATLWAVYALFWLLLIALSVFVWEDVSQALGESKRPGKVVAGLIFGVGFLGAPLIELFARRRTSRGQGNHENQGPGAGPTV